MSNTIIAFGDSVTVGTPAKLDVFQTTQIKVRETQTWPAILERILTDWIPGGCEVVNAGVAGDDTATAVKRVKDDVLGRSPDQVLLLFGLEDALGSVAARVFQATMQQIVQAIRERGAVPVLLTPPPVSERMTVAGFTLAEVRVRQQRLSDLADVVRSIAEEQSLTLIDLHRWFLENRLAYDHLFDGPFPDGVAQTSMASFVAGRLLEMDGITGYPEPLLCDYRKAYTDVSGDPRWKHNAFTDLTVFHGEFFLTFRNGAGHCPPPPPSGRVIVLRSRDGISWEKDATLIVEGVDHQADPKFLQVDNRLFVYSPTTLGMGTPTVTHMTYGFERLGSGEWSEGFECAPCVFWRAKKWGEKYAVAPYAWADKSAAVKLLTSTDGRAWEETSDILAFDTGGNETDLLVNDDELVAFARTGEGSDNEMLISTYVPSKNRWQTVSSGRNIQAPCVFREGERIFVTGRYCSQSDEGFKDLRRDWNAFNYGTEGESVQADPARVERYHHGLRTGVFVMDGTTPRLVMELLSAGDSSYTGAVQYGGEWLISDYSMHEYYPPIRRPGDWNTPNDIYISRIRFNGGTEQGRQQ